MASSVHRRARRAALLPAALALVTLAATACAGTTQSDPFTDPGDRSIRIDVTNLNFNDATLHAIRGAERHRLGIVSGKGSASYTLGWPLSMPLRIEIDLLAGDACTTRALQVDPGDVIDLQIEMDLRRDPDCYGDR